MGLAMQSSLAQTQLSEQRAATLLIDNAAEMRSLVENPFGEDLWTRCASLPHRRLAAMLK